MAVLSDSDRSAIWADFMASAGPLLETLFGMSKTDIRAAVDAADSWADSNAASFNTAIPQPARGAMTAKQKARLLVWVVERRWKIQ
jgi:hypothetical protein